MSTDTLTWTNQAGITANYNAGTGVLTLSGSATLATYQTLLRSIAYSSSSDNPAAAGTERNAGGMVSRCMRISSPTFSD